MTPKLSAVSNVSKWRRNDPSITDLCFVLALSYQGQRCIGRSRSSAGAVPLDDGEQFFRSANLLDRRIRLDRTAFRRHGRGTFRPIGVWVFGKERQNECYL
jgi:hypothetical protein